MNFNKICRIEMLFNDRLYARSTAFDCYDNVIDMLIGDHEMKISEGRLVTVLAYDLSGNRSRADAKIISCENGKLVVETTSEFKEDRYRRRALKLPAEPPIPAHITIQDKQYDVVVKDISVTGVFILFEETLVTGHRCHIDIGQIDVSCDIRIIRRQGDNSGYGCEFIDIVPADEDKIAQYLFKRQIEERELMKRRKNIL